MDSKKIVNGFIWIIGTLLLGALGSGFWEIAIKPGGIWAIDKSWTFILTIFSSLSDAMYQDVARGRVERLDQIIFAFGSGAGLGIIFVVFIRRFKNGTEKLSSVLSWNDSFPRILILVMLSSTLFSTGTKYSFVLKKIEEYERMLSIATPYVSYETVANFKKDFALIISSDDYNFLMQNMVKAIPKENIKIPKNLTKYFEIK